MGHVPQRPVHRAGHQTDRRLHVRTVAIEPEYVMKIDGSLGLLGVLLEPTTVVTKAWEQVQAVGQRAFWEPGNVLVTGAGPIGLLAALVCRQHGLDVHVLDRVVSGPKPELVRALGATYHTGR